MPEKRIKYFGVDFSLRGYIAVQILSVLVLLGLGIAFRDTHPLFSKIAFIGVPLELLETYFGLKKRSYIRE